MKILSVNVSKPESYTLDGVTLHTSMIKKPQTEIQINIDSITGDEFSGKHVHGTIDAVVYALSSKNYDYWSEFCGKKLGLGHFGENLSLDNLNEAEIYLGDEFQCGADVMIRVSGVRYPCNRLNFVTGNTKMRDEFLNQDWPGVYFEVVTTGKVKPGDSLVLKQRVQSEISTLTLYQGLRAAERKNISDQQFQQLIESNLVAQKYKDRIFRVTGRVKPS